MGFKILKNRFLAQPILQTVFWGGLYMFINKKAYSTNSTFMSKNGSV